MKKVYISSTYKDLINYRNAVATALRKDRYDVIRMEEYVARDLRTRAACEADVAKCDIYVGIFAWRYGHIPKDDNEEGRSITELEYRKASGDKTCLIFLLREKASWPKRSRDQGDRGKRVNKLRKELRGRCAGYFSTSEELAVEVLLAIHQHEATKKVEQLNLLEEIKESVNLGESYLPNIQNKIIEAADAEIVEISLGPTPWWTTRLHLVAALASDFTSIRQFVFLDKAGQYILMAPTIEVRAALTRRFPQLERAYLQSRPAGPPCAAAAEISHIVNCYQHEVLTAFGNRKEQDVKEDISRVTLERDLGIKPSAEKVEHRESRLILHRDIVGRNTPYVVLLAKGKLVSVIDRLQMASKIAVQSLEEVIG